MSGVTIAAQPQLATPRSPVNSPLTGCAPPAAVAFHYTQSESFVDLLQQLDASLLVSTYQANKLLAVRVNGPGLSTLVRSFDRPMGIAIDARRLTIGTRREMWFLSNAPDIAPRFEPAGTHDACYLPRSSHVTGDIGIHEVAYGKDELWMVSTRFSCLCTLSPDYSFMPRWRPKIAATSTVCTRSLLNYLEPIFGCEPLHLSQVTCQTYPHLRVEYGLPGQHDEPHRRIELGRFHAPDSR